MSDLFMHSPGPWSVVDGYYHGFEEINGPSFKISIVMSASDVSFEDSCKRTADAKLISAAPDMLEALIIAEKLCGSLTSDQCNDSIHIAIKDAIGKAKGFRS